MKSSAGRTQARERFGDTGCRTNRLWPHVMGELGFIAATSGARSVRARAAVAPSAEMAEELCMIGTRQMFYARLPEVKGSAGSVAFALDEVLRASPAYRWTLNHTLRCDDPLELFPTHMTVAGVK
jgi:hypothetical protein